MTSPLPDFLDHLVNVKRSGSGYSARCPSHDDHRASLSISEGEAGQVLVYCHAGCELDAIVSAAGVAKSDLFGAPRLVAEYPYTDEAGVPVYYAERWAPKDFRVRMADGARRWPKAGARVLYNLPLLSYARSQRLGVVVCEGEKDADRAVAEGFIATTTLGGAGKPWQPQYSDALAGLKVTVFADNDKPGLAWARKVRDELTDVCELVSVRVPAVKGAKDISDLFDAGKTLSDSLPVAESLGEVIAANSYEPAQVSWLWDQRIPHHALTLLEGDPGTGKSTLVAELIGCLTTGRALPEDKPGFAPYTVGMLADEDNWPMTVVPKLIAAGADLSRVLHFVGTRDGDFTAPYSLDDLATLRHDVRAHKVNVLIVDPLAAYLGGSNTDTHRDSSVRSLLGPLAQMAEQDQVTVLAIRHFTKAEGGKAIHKGGGSVAFVGQARSVLQTGLVPTDEPTEPGEGVEYGLAVAKNNLAALAPTLGYQLKASPDEPLRISWAALPVPFSAQQLIDPPKPKERPVRTSARDFLRDLLRETGRPMSWKEILDAATEAGHAAHTLRDVREDVAEQVPGSEGRRDVKWRLTGARGHLSLVPREQIPPAHGHMGNEPDEDFTAAAIEKRLREQPESPYAHMPPPVFPAESTTDGNRAADGPLVCNVCGQPALFVSAEGPRCRHHNPLTYQEEPT